MTVTILQGDVHDRLRELPDESVHCVVTSPPYWGLRDYGTAKWEGGDPLCEHLLTGVKRTPWANEVKGPGSAGKNGTRYANMTKWVGGECVVCGAQKVDEQIGLETCLGDHIDALVDVFREVRRVLRKDGTLWLNYGDAYASSPNGRSAADTKKLAQDDRTFRDKPISTVGAIYIPDYEKTPRYGKSENFGNVSAAHGGRVVGAGGTLKPKDRLLLPARVAIALQADGWWVRDEIVWHKPNPMPSSVKDRTTPAHEMIYLLTRSQKYAFAPMLEPIESPSKKKIKVPGGWDKGEGAHGTIHREGRAEAQYVDAPERETRNKRSVWTVAPAPFAEAHFATFPPALITPCILAGCPEGGTVLDPFFGAGTTGLVCQELNRNCIGIELNAAYVVIAEKRLGLRAVSETETTTMAGFNARWAAKEALEDLL